MSKKINEEGLVPKKLTAETQSAHQIRAAYSTIRYTSYFESLIHFSKGNIGAGIFAMGIAIKNAGLAVGCFGTIFLGAVCAYNMHILVGSAIYIKEKLNLEDLPNYPEIVELCFYYGPTWTKNIRKCAKLMVRTYIIATQLGFCSIYIVFVASEILELVADRLVEIPRIIHIYILMVAPVAVLTALIPSLKFLTPLSFLANICLLIGLALSAYLCSETGYPSIFERPMYSTIDKLPLFFSTAIFAFEGISLVIPIYNDMKSPDLFYASYGVLNLGMGFYILISTAMGVISYWKFGEEILDSVTLNFDDGPISLAVKICVPTGILLTYAIQFHVAVDVTWWDLVRVFELRRHLLCKEFMYRLVLSLFTVLVAGLVPYLHLFLSLIGAVFSSALALIFPALCDIAVRTSPEEEGRLESRNWCFRVFRLLMDGFTIVLALMGIVAGTTTSVIGLYYAFKDNPKGHL